MSRTTRWLLVGALGVLVADQLTKALIVAALDEGSRSSIDLFGSLQLVHLRNTGFAFSTGQGLGPLLTLLVPVIVAVLWRSRDRLGGTFASLALGATIGGAIGNLADRVVRSPGWGRGGVVDWIDVGFWPVFNLADAAIVVGVAVIGWRLVGERPPKPPVDGDTQDRSAS